MSGARRLFQSPPKYKSSMVSSTKGGTKIYQNKLEEIMEEDNNHQVVLDNQSAFINNSHSNDNEANGMEASFNKRRGLLPFEDEDLFTTPSIEQNQQHNQLVHSLSFM